MNTSIFFKKEIHAKGRWALNKKEISTGKDLPKKKSQN